MALGTGRDLDGVIAEPGSVRSFFMAVLLRQRPHNKKIAVGGAQMSTQTMTLGEAMAAAAEKELGNAENPRASNRGEQINKYFEACGLAPGMEWCLVFCNAMYKQEKGGNPPWGIQQAFVPSLVAWAKQNGRWMRENDPQDQQFARAEPSVGDLLIVGDFLEPHFSRQHHYKHVAMVVEVHQDMIVTIDGNHGHAVTKNRRSRMFDGVRDYIAGYVKIEGKVKKKEELPSTTDLGPLEKVLAERLILTLDDVTGDPALIKAAQARLCDLGLLDPSIDIDGEIGPRTIKAVGIFCEHVHLNNAETGVFGPSFAKALLETRKLHSLADHEFSTKKTPANLKKALEFTLRWEGGFVNHPADPGGATNKGITQAVYNRYRISKQQRTQTVENITDKEVHDIYFSNYWKPSKAEELDEALSIVQFDTAVNFGVGGAIMFVQEALGLPMSGRFTTATLEGLMKNNTKAFAKKIVKNRIAYRHERVAKNSSQKVFLQGWLNRDNDLMKFID